MALEKHKQTTDGNTGAAMSRNKSRTVVLLAMLLAAAVGLGFSLAATPRAALQDAAPKITRLDPRFDELVPRDAVLEKIASGIAWAEGPVWNRTGGFLLFSDVPNNAIFKWKPGEGVSLFLKPSGYAGGESFPGREPGSNGLVFDSEGRLVFCQHGDRRISRMEKDGSIRVLADRYLGRRINSPNDLVFKSNGDLYFTDPPFGLPKSFEDPKRELDFCGVYRLERDGKLTLLTKEVQAPNGIAFSPDEKTLYVSDSKRTLWLAFAVKEDGTLGTSRVLFDGSELGKSKPGVADGLKVDVSRQHFRRCAGWTVRHRARRSPSGAVRFRCRYRELRVGRRRLHALHCLEYEHVSDAVEHQGSRPLARLVLVPDLVRKSFLGGDSC